MLIETASWNDILPILRTNFRIWSPGLSESDYRHYIWSQLQAPWARHNLRYVTYREGGETKASCKTYQLTFRSRGKSFTFAALGAVFTQEKFRGKGWARKLIEALIEQFKDDSIDGILLFSDINPDFYQTLGFEQMGSAEFNILLAGNDLENSNVTVREVDKYLSTANFLEYHALSGNGRQDLRGNAAQTCYLDPGIDSNVIAEMTRHYSRWLSRQPFGIERPENYLAYKLGRERFIATHSKIGWPGLIVTIADFSTNEYGYALTECSGMTMRILEIIGSPLARQELWKGLYKKALGLGIKRIRGWESVAADFAPSYSYRSILTEASGSNALDCKILSFQRDWGRPMLLAFNQEALAWHKAFPCPLLELDL